MASLLLYQLTLAGVFLINVLQAQTSPVFVAVAAISLVMAVCTLVFWRTVHRKFAALGKYGALEAPFLLDEIDELKAAKSKRATRKKPTKSQLKEIDEEEEDEDEEEEGGGEVKSKKKHESQVVVDVDETANAEETGDDEEELQPPKKNKGKGKEPAVEIGIEEEEEEEKKKKKKEPEPVDAPPRTSSRRRHPDWANSTTEPLDAAKIFAEITQSSSSSSATDETPLNSESKSKSSSKSKQEDREEDEGTVSNPLRTRLLADDTLVSYTLGSSIYDEAALAVAYRDPALTLSDVNVDKLAVPLLVV